MSWLVVILGLGLLVFLHELGHFTVSRLVGMKPRAFYVGFPPALVKVERNGIEYGLGAIPLGGYVRIPGMLRPASTDFSAQMAAAVREEVALEPAAEKVVRALDVGDYGAARAALPALVAAVRQTSLSSPAQRSAERAMRDVDEGTGSDAYWRQPIWKRVAAIAAGPAMNVLVAFLIFFVVYATGAPSHTPSTTVAKVEAGSPAAAAGLRAGDRIVAVDGHAARTLAQVHVLIAGSRGRPVTVTVERGGGRATLGPRRTVSRHGRWVWGFVPAVQLVSHPLGASTRLAIGDCWRVVTGTVTAVVDLARTESSAGISGPVGIVRSSQQYLMVGLQWYLQLLGLISMSLALYNLLPLLPLDGGNILFALLEGVRRRALPRAMYQRFSSAGMGLILLITVIAFWNDIGATPR